MLEPDDLRLRQAQAVLPLSRELTCLQPTRRILTAATICGLPLPEVKYWTDPPRSKIVYSMPFRKKLVKAFSSGIALGTCMHVGNSRLLQKTSVRTFRTCGELAFLVLYSLYSLASTVRARGRADARLPSPDPLRSRWRVHGMSLR